MIIVFAVFLIAIIILQCLARVTVKVWPQTHNLAFQAEVLVDTEIIESDISQGLIRGRLISAERELSREFPATGIGIEEEKASGQITVFNEYHLPNLLLISSNAFRVPSFVNPPICHSISKSLSIFPSIQS